MLELPKQNNARIARNTAFLYARMFLVLIISLYTSRVVLKSLGASDYGIYNVVAGFVTLFAFINTSLTGAVQRFYNYEGSKRGEVGVNSVYAVSIVIQIVFSVVLVALLESFGLWYLNNVMVIPPDRVFAAQIVYQLSVLSLITIFLQIPFSAIIVSLERMDFYALVGVVDVIFKLIIACILPRVSFDSLIFYAILLCLVTVLDFSLYYFYAKRTFKFLKFSSSLVDKNLLKSMLSFSGWNLLGTFSSAVYGQGINLVLNKFFGTIVNAARGLSFQIMNALHGFVINLTMAFRPQLIDSYACGDYNRTRNILFFESKCCYLLLLLLITPVILEIDYILKIWLGDSVPDNTAIFTILVLLYMLETSYVSPFAQVIHATGKMKKYHIVTSIIICSNIPVSYLALKCGGEATIVFYISLIIGLIMVVAVMALVAAVFDYGVSLFTKKVIFPCVLVSLLSPILPLAARLIMPESFLRFILVSSMSIIATLSIIYAIALEDKERKKVITIIKNHLPFR